MSLRKYDEEGSDRKAKTKSDMNTAVKEKTDKKAHKKRMKLENKQIRRQIRKYKILGIPRKLRAQWKLARKEYRRAAQREKRAKKSKHYKDFAEEHQLNKPVQSEPDYPQIGKRVPPTDLPAEEDMGESVDDDHIILGHVQVEKDDGESANLADSQESSAQADAQDDDSDSDTDDDADNTAADNTAADSGPSDDEKEVQRELAEASKMDNALSDGAVQSMSDVDKLLHMPDAKL